MSVRRLVSLPMYAPPEGALNAFAAGLLAGLRRAGFAPEWTVPGDLYPHWNDPALLLSQTCGYPLTHALAGRVTLVATPVYDAPGCEGPFYRSAVVVRAVDPARRPQDLAGKIAAYNGPDSQSGFHALRAAIAPLARGPAFFGGAIETGSHHGAIEAVLAGRADAAAIDAVTLALWRDAHPDAPLRVLCETPAAPALPFVTAADTAPEALARLREGLLDCIRDPALAPARRAMRLKGVEILPLAAYDAILWMEDAAARSGLVRL
ncbi:phosphate ABC transporter substrate-binding protein [Aureimonas endophytica]|uniref:Phosphate ABC transporter substrate-binding protein n=1 Tax=Aureimonas endophytica TaxID=2027858 RepID=A0A916ZSH9_9HYPH|nr:PhnD/SsuA/transferrin family substrate-binding protein [Aureimonas endophytica]GGE12180.1 phosphate ABC transporter substrate-binding protein [Aureimonas endophytica]